MYEVKGLLLGSANYIYPNDTNLPIIRIYISNLGEVNFAFWNNSGKWENFYIEHHDLFKKIKRRFIFSKIIYVIHDLPPIEELYECLIEELRLQLE